MCEYIGFFFLQKGVHRNSVHACESLSFKFTWHVFGYAVVRIDFGGIDFIKLILVKS